MEKKPRPCPYLNKCYTYRIGSEKCQNPCNDESYRTCGIFKIKNKEEKTMENNTLEKALDMAGSMTKLAANLTEKRDNPPQKVIPVSSDDSNKATTGSQSVVISVDGNGSKRKEPKPIEKHIHEFPEHRALTPEECELALKKAQMEYAAREREQAYLEKVKDREWQHHLEVEKTNEKKGKIRRILACLCGAGGIGIVGYSLWSDYRHSRAAAVAGKALPETVPAVKGEGSVQ